MPKRSQKKIPVDLVTATISHLNHEGRGIAHIDGKATFIFGALPGEQVQFKYTRCHAKYDEGTAVEILEKSPDRAIPRCPHFGICGGCSLQHMATDKQQSYKQSILLEHLKHQANVEPINLLPIITGNTWGYRRRARISVRWVLKKNKVLVGFRERGTSFVADMSQCETLYPSVGHNIQALSDLFMQLETKSEIAQIEVAISDTITAIIVRHLVALPEHDTQKLIQFATDNHWHLYFQPKGPDTIHAVYPLPAKELFYEIILPERTIKMVFKPSQFIQINAEVNAKMITQAIQLLDLQPSDVVLDLFCGIGNFSLPIATLCQKVVGVEGSESSISQAKSNAVLNNINNTEFFTHDLCADLSTTAWINQIYTKIVIDPPRLGAKELMPYIALWKPQRIVYISCNPITLARDTQILLQLGYRLEKAGVMDMFPHTEHIEAMALFIKQ